MLLLFGKNGQVARELQIAAADRGITLQVYSSDEADFRYPQQVLHCLQNRSPGTCVVNAAAYTHVDQAESEADVAECVNAVTPGLIAEECQRRNLHFIHLSTDYVFSGDQTAPYAEDDPTGPVNVYGRTKLLGEQRILKAFPQAIVLRTSWVFSSHGKNFVTTMLKLAQTRDRLSVVDDQWGGPTSAAAIARTILRIAQRISQSSSDSSPAGLYHYAGAPPTSWHGFAKEIFQQAKLHIALQPIATAQYPTPAARPNNSILDCHRILQDYGIPQPDWKQDLAEVIRQFARPI